MERFQDPERLAALFARCRIPERLPWTAAYPWTLQYYEKGEYLCRLREPMESLYLLLEGGIQTSLTNAAGRTRLVATAQPGELVGGDVEVVLGNVQATTDQRAQEDGALCAALPLAEYREALCSDLGFLRYASRRLARIVVMNTFRATNDLLLPLENRLAAYLLSQAEDGWFHGTLTRTAETLSTSYRQLTRVMSRFAQAGYLRRTPEGWRLEEPDALQALAERVGHGPAPLEEPAVVVGHHELAAHRRRAAQLPAVAGEPVVGRALCLEEPGGGRVGGGVHPVALHAAVVGVGHDPARALQAPVVVGQVHAAVGGDVLAAHHEALGAGVGPLAAPDVGQQGAGRAEALEPVALQAVGAVAVVHEPAREGRSALVVEDRSVGADRPAVGNRFLGGHKRLLHEPFLVVESVLDLAAIGLAQALRKLSLDRLIQSVRFVATRFIGQNFALFAFVTFQIPVEHRRISVNAPNAPIDRKSIKRPTFFSLID